MPGKKIWMPFIAARNYVHALRLKNYSEWREWTKSTNRPLNIPSNPRETYKDEGWISWGDWLGTGARATQNRKYRSFLEARQYAHSLGFKSRADWEKFRKTNEFPKDIPAKPDVVYCSQGWISWGDFLGTGIIAWRYRKIRPFLEARDYARSLGFKSQTEWHKYAKNGFLPKDIPSYPNEAYLDKGWVSWGDWLGNGIIASQNREFKPFSEAREFVRALGLKNNKEWRIWSKSDKIPNDIPTAPDHVYANEGWISWGDFLGTGAIGSTEKNFRPFNEARIFARSLKFKMRKEWANWAKTKNRPNDIPASPSITYKNKGWNGWGDWLGTGNTAHFKKEFRPFLEARSFARGLNLHGKDEWAKWSKTSARPKDIPTAPDRTYANNGWQGWEDWLGVDNKWTIQKLRLFVKSLLPHIPNMPQMDRLVLLQTRGIFDATKGKIIAKKILQADEMTLKELEKFANNKQSSFDLLLTNNDLVSEENENEIDALASVFDPATSFNAVEDFPVVETKNSLAALSQSIIGGCDKETAEFLVKSQVARIWKHAFEDPEGALLQSSVELPAEEIYMRMAQEQFLNEFEEAQKLEIPSGYSFPFPPELMQKYTASLVKTRRRIGNWCGTGAGKTLASILASRIIKAQLTVICCPNNVIDTWRKEILQSFPDSLVIIKNFKQALKETSRPTYLILNYEVFKEKNTEHLLNRFIQQKIIEFIIIDEIHCSKQRKPETLSQRRKALLSFLDIATKNNPNLHVLGMSATPVINNLYEGKTLIEMITGMRFDDLETRPTRNNCVSLYKQLILHGFRWLPNYKIHLNLTPENFINCSWLLPDIIKLLNIEKGNLNRKAINPQPLEALLTKAKIPFILNNLKPSTIIYTYYVEDIVIQLQRAVEDAGWRVGLFTGTNKDGLEPFLRKEVDVLIVSNCASTGLDGLQKVSNRIIINSLPWTHAEFKQLQGRILRKGQPSNQIEILIPLTFIEVDGKKWSWCESRWERIKFKKSIADAAVDGFLPEGMHISEQQAMQEAKLWIHRILSGKINEIIREPINASLEGQPKVIDVRKIADLTKMNQAINNETSKQTHERFKDQAQFYEYHNIYHAARKGWDVIPYKEAIAWCALMPDWIIGDFGCGEAFLSKELSNKVYAFDHVAINHSVIACDMSKVPLKSEMLDAAVFSLSLMGTNFIDYLKEAKRCLKLYGHLWIAEPTSRIQDQALFIDLLQRLGFDVYHTSQKGKFTFIKAIKSNRSINEIILQELVTQKILD